MVFCTLGHVTLEKLISAFFSTKNRFFMCFYCVIVESCLRYYPHQLHLDDASSAYRVVLLVIEVLVIQYLVVFSCFWLFLVVFIFC